MSGIDLAGHVRKAVAGTDLEQLRAAVTAALDLHGEHVVRDPGRGCEPYSICADCCTGNDDQQSVSCRVDHEHFGPPGGRCWPCSTWFVVARVLGVRAPELGLR